MAKAARKTATKTTPIKKSATKKSTTKRPGTKKPATKKSATKRSATKRTSVPDQAAPRARRKPVASLTEYHRKRDFEQTAEPEGKLAARGGDSFCVQKHDATHLHYDFRLELDGVLKSWAVPKGPSFDPADKRLAVHVEDHPLDYGSFEGTIPHGEYGGGTVMLWDRGTWTPLLEPHEGYRAGHLKFTLDGEKLKGRWILVRRGGRSSGADERNWFLIKERDEFARPHDEFNVTEQLNLSVKTGRNLDEIAAGAPAKRKTAVTKHTAASSPAARRAAPRAKKAKASGKKSKAPGEEGRRSALPAFVQPQLATLIKSAPVGNHWFHEIKLDGYRMLGRMEHGKVRFISRNQQDWTDRFRTLAKAVANLPVERALFDGEVVVLDTNGKSSFQSLQNVLSEGRGGELVYFIFDLLHLNGRDLTGLPLEERKRILADVVPNTQHGAVQLVEHLEGNGPEFFQQACRVGLEGIISKRRDQPYRPGRGDDWTKTKCQMRDEFVIVGYTDPSGARYGFGALVVGYHDQQGDLVFAGKVGTGFSEKTLEQLTERLKQLQQPTSPLDKPAPSWTRRRVHWVRPELVAQVEFSEWTRDGVLRHPSFQGLREDKPAAQVVRDRAKSTDEIKPAAVDNSHATNGRAKQPIVKQGNAMARSTQEASGDAMVGGVRITHPDRVLYPEQGITKRAIAEYYEQVADWMLPHVVHRPLTLVRCPEGRAKQCFYQKHVDTGVPASLGRISIQEKLKVGTYGIIENLTSLLGLVQFGVLEIHLWGARADDIERPDRLVFDLDPDPTVEWKRVVEAARMLRERLGNLGLETFVKTTGGKGLHVVLPIRRRDEWEAMKQFCRAVVEQVVREAPEAYTANMSKVARKGKIFIDYLRNERGATWVAPYSTRARAGAPVSTPLDWDELSPRIAADYYTVENVPARLRKLKRDPWAGIADVKQTITAKIKQAVSR